MPDLRQRRRDASDGDLYRENLTKELKTTGRYTLCPDVAGHPTRGSRVRVIERRVEDAGSYVAKLRRTLHACHQLWSAIFARREQAGIQHYFVEHDEPADPLASVRASDE